MCISIIHHLYTALCPYHSKSNHLPCNHIFDPLYFSLPPPPSPGNHYTVVYVHEFLVFFFFSCLFICFLNLLIYLFCKYLYHSGQMICMSRKIIYLTFGCLLNLLVLIVLHWLSGFSCGQSYYLKRVTTLILSPYLLLFSFLFGGFFCLFVCLVLELSDHIILLILPANIFVKLSLKLVLRALDY